MTPDYTPLRALFSDAGYAFVEPPIVYPASVFVDLAGEDLRRRLYLTSGADGAELALRPDYTIPVCLRHLATGAAGRKANYAYLGPVFRIRENQPGEFLQAGVESLGRTDRVAADADILKLAFAAAGLLGVRRPRVRIGDSALFAAVLDKLGLNAPWRRRLARAFGDTKRLKALIPRSSRGTEANGKATPVPAPLAGAGPGSRSGASKDKVRRAVEARFAATGIGAVAGRPAGEIADRFVEKQALAHGIGERAAKVLTAFLAIGGTPKATLAALGALARRERLDIGKAIDRFEKRAEAFAAHGIDIDRLTFAADFGRRLDYYTGFVFEFHRPGRSDAGPIVGGGRYDRMTALIPRAADGPAGVAVPAVGFSIWLDRIGESSPSPGGGRSTAKRAGGGEGAQRRVRSAIHPAPRLRRDPPPPGEGETGGKS